VIDKIITILGFLTWLGLIVGIAYDDRRDDG